MLFVKNLELISAAKALQVVGQLPVIHLRAEGRVQEPPGGSTDSRSAYVETDGHVSEALQTFD